MLPGVIAFLAVAAVYQEPPVAPEITALAREYFKTPTLEIERKLMKLADSGNEDASALLGEILQMRDRPGGPEMESACRYAAKTSRPSAVHNLATCYFKGDGVVKDLVKARELYQKASSAGFPKARCALGNMMILGLGGSRQVAEGVALCRSAAEAGVADAQADYGGYLLMGTGGQKDTAEAQRWLRMAADQRHANASFLLGQMYWKGDGVPQDFTEAAKWLRQAFDLGRQDASSLLLTEALRRGVRKQDGQTTIDREAGGEALYWATIASETASDPRQRAHAAEIVQMLRGLNIEPSKPQ